MGDNKTKLTITFSKVRNDFWKIKSGLPNLNSCIVSIPVIVYHNFRKNQSNNLKQLRAEQTKVVAKPVEKSESSHKNKVSITNENGNRFDRLDSSKPMNIKAAENGTQNSLSHNPNIAIGIVSLLQPDTIASILRQNNVEIPMSLNNLSNNVPNTDKDINNNNRSDASTGEPCLQTRDDGNTNNSVNVDNITKSNQTETLHKRQDKVEETKEREVNVLDMETQTDNLIEVEDYGQESLDEPVLGEHVPLEVPTAPTMDNTPRNFVSQDAIQKLRQLNDWNKFLLQTNMGRTQQDWFDPNAGKKNTPVRKSGQRKRKSTSIVEYDPDLFLTRHMMLNNSVEMSGLAGQEVPMSTAPFVPSMLLAPGYNTRSSQRLDPAYQFNQNIQYIPQQPVNVVPPMMYNNYPPNIRHPAPCRPSMTVTSTRGQMRKSRWQVPVDTQMNQFLEVQRYGMTALRAHTTQAVPTNHMANQIFIDDPRRRTRKQHYSTYYTSPSSPKLSN